MQYSDPNKTSRNTIVLYKNRRTFVISEATYSSFGGRLSSPYTRIISEAANGAQPGENIQINNIYIAKSNPKHTEPEISGLSSLCPDISIPIYNQGPENGPHDPSKGTGTCQCATGLSQINAALGKLPHLKDSNPQIDLNHLYHCFPVGSPDNINGVPGDPRAAPFPDPNKSDAQICEYILRTISTGSCFPVKVQCNTSDTASKTNKPDCNNQTCVKWFKLKNVSKPPKFPTLDDIKKQLCSGKPVAMTLSGNLLDDIIHDNNTDNYTSNPKQYIWPGVGGHGFNNHSHSVTIIGFTQTETSITLRCQNSWGGILTYIDIVIPLDKLNIALQSSAKIGDNRDIHNPTLWDFNIVDCDWFPSPIPPECCGGCCCSNGSINTTLVDKQSCESCTHVITCSESLFLDDDTLSCPEGWFGSSGYCSRNIEVSNCSECAGECYEYDMGPCGKWNTGVDCDNIPQPNCQVPEICLNTDQIAVTLPASDYCSPRGFVFLNPSYTLTLQPNGSYTFGAGNYVGYVNISLYPECFRWKLLISGGGIIPGDPYSYSTVTVEADFGPVVDGTCGPAIGLSGSGTAKWSGSGCLINPSYNPVMTQQSSGVLDYNASTTTGSCE